MKYIYVYILLLNVIFADIAVIEHPDQNKELIKAINELSKEINNLNEKKSVSQTQIINEEKLDLSKYDMVSNGMGTVNDPIIILEKPSGRLVKYNNQYYKIITEKGYDHYNRRKAVNERFDLDYINYQNMATDSGDPAMVDQMMEYEEKNFVKPVKKIIEIQKPKYLRKYPYDENVVVSKSPLQEQINLNITEEDKIYDYMKNPKRYQIIWFMTKKLENIIFGSKFEELNRYVLKNKIDAHMSIIYITTTESDLMEFVKYQSDYPPRLTVQMFLNKGHLERALKGDHFGNIMPTDGSTIVAQNYISMKKSRILFIDKSARKWIFWDIDDQTAINPDANIAVNYFLGFVKK